MAKRKDGVKATFPGANSVTFMVNHINDIQLNKTIVCEKTDGVRYFLIEVVVKPSIAGQMPQSKWLIVDRNYTIETEGRDRNELI